MGSDVNFVSPCIWAPYLEGADGVQNALEPRLVSLLSWSSGGQTALHFYNLFSLLIYQYQIKDQGPPKWAMT